MRDDSAQEKALVQEFVAALVARAQEVGGTCTGEHGIGIGKRQALVAEVGEASVDAKEDSTPRARDT